MNACVHLRTQKAQVLQELRRTIIDTTVCLMSISNMQYVICVPQPTEKAKLETSIIIALQPAQAEKNNAVWKKLHKQEQLRVEAESLPFEIKEAEGGNHNHRTSDNEDRCESIRVHKDMHQNYREIRRQEHYREWLTTQNILDSMHQADICNGGSSNIPVHDK